MGVFGQIMENIGKFFLLLGMILTAIVTEISLTHFILADPDRRAIYQSLIVAVAVSYLASIILVGYLLYKPKYQPQEQTSFQKYDQQYKPSQSPTSHDTMNNYIGHIYIVVNKNKEQLEYIRNVLDQLTQDETTE